MNLKDFLNKALYEGGAAGHMMHPYDKFEDPADMLEFFENFLAGKITGTEKVDGFNLFAGLEDGTAVAVRNKNEAPMDDINKKFGMNHPAHNGFTAGWRAIKEGLESLTDAEVTKFNLNDNFINMELLYGYIPNAVPYSQTTNFIVFHGFMGKPENNWQPDDIENQDQILRELANKLGIIRVETPNITFVGSPDDVKRKVEILESEWKFYGPIEINEKDVKKHLKDVVSQWKKYPEVQALLKFSKSEDNMDLTSLEPEELKDHQDQKFKLMKAATKKIGSAVLSNMVSKLSDTGEVVPGYPGIEGIVTRQGNDLVKITGDFLDYSRPEDTPALDATKKLREVIQKEILGLNTTTLRGVKSLSQLYDYVMNRKKKKYAYELDHGIPTTEKEKIREAIAKTKDEVRKVVKIIQDKGRAFDLKNLLIQSFMLTNIEKQLDKVNSYKDLLDLYGRELYSLG